MRSEDNIQLRDAWIAVHYAENGTAEHDALFWAWQRVNKLCTEEPEEALEFVLAVLAHDRSPRILSNLAAGPMEDLLARHPHRMIEAVEAAARRNPQFASLLGGVWQNAIPDDIFNRVRALAPARW
jgi:hypothetical protein